MSIEVQLDHKKIQQLRMQKCWSQDELASASNLSIRTIQRVEKTGNASLETIKALAAVFEVSVVQLQIATDFPHLTFNFIYKYAWLFAFAISSLMFGLWIIDILIPTLKGADFNQQYELHGNFRYLDYGGISSAAGFILLAVNILVDYLQRKKLTTTATQ